MAMKTEEHSKVVATIGCAVAALAYSFFVLLLAGVLALCGW